MIPTYNRSGLLRRTIESLFCAEIPAGLDINLFVVDNNSKDDTEQVVREMQLTAPLPLHYVRETKQGLSHARNGGIAAGGGDVVGFIDDDEEIVPNWFNVIAQEFQDLTVNYIGGPCLPNWEIPAPDWLPPGYHSVIGAIPPKPRGRYGPSHPGMLNGGNAVLRRSVFDQIGVYSTRLGRSGKGLLSDEDAELFRRIEKAGISGMYVPDLKILHYIPAERLTRTYHRRWAYWRGVSQGVLDREIREPVPYLFGVPRHRIGRTLRSALAYPAHRLSRATQGRAFADELATWDLLGFIYGRYFINIEKLYADQK